MSDENTQFGLSAATKNRLLARLTRHPPAAVSTGINGGHPRSVERSRRGIWDDLPGQRDIEMVARAAEKLGIPNLFFRSHEVRAGAQTAIGGREYLNFSSYDYLGLNGHPQIAAAAMAAIERFGTSVSASRMVSGERPVHRDLEQAMARFYGVEDALCFVSGHATNVTVIGHLLQAGDLILHDQLIHNSVTQGAALSGARRHAFRHNDLDAARRLLASHRRGHKHALLVIEGHYSMDGDIPDLPGFVDLAREYDCWLMVDEAHAMGILGRCGRGIAEHYGIAPTDVDIWMGTLSKALVSCGGYIAGSAKLIEFLKYSAPGFVYSVGMPASAAAAATTALELLIEEPDRISRLNANAARFLSCIKQAGLDTGASIGAAIVPVITGSSIKAGRLSHALFERGINIQPILYPAVPERSARLRFFLSAAHTEQQIDTAAALVAEEAARL